MALVTLGSFVTGLMTTAFIGVAVLMILIVLIQKPRGGGLSGAFGGGGGGGDQGVFGAKVGDVLTWVTVGFFVGFLLLAMVLVWMSKADNEAAGLGVTPTVEAAPDPTPELDLGALGAGVDTEVDPTQTDTPDEAPVVVPPATE